MRALFRAACLCLALSGVGADAAARSPSRPVTRPAKPLTPNLGRLARAERAARPASDAPRVSLESRLGLAVAERLLRSADERDRVRALERLGAIGDARALEMLLAAIDNNGPAAFAEARLAAVRALWPHAANLDVRQALVRLVSSPGGDDDMRRSAALALAASRDRGALLALGKIVLQEGKAAEAARDAIVAHPPVDLSSWLAALGTPNVTLARTLSELADQRAFHALRRAVRFGSLEARAEAALALTRLGDLETVELARHWQKRESSAVLRLAAAEIFALTHAPDYPAAVLALLARPDTEAAALKLALQAPHPQLVPALAARLSDADDPSELIAAIARAGGARATKVLAGALATTERVAAAYALALMPGDEAAEVLEAQLAKPESRAWAACAGVVRQLVLDEHISGLESALERLLASPSGAERAAGAWGLAALDEGRARALLGSRDLVVVRAAARLAMRGELARAAARRLARERDALTESALATALLTKDGADALATDRLEELLRELPAGASLAARALAARDEPRLRPRITSLLESPDPNLRAHTALGLGESASSNVIGLLAERYRSESSASVRRAIVAALSRRAEPTRGETLYLAAMLDPDRLVRDSARAALAGRTLGYSGQGTSSFWLELRPTSAGALEPQALELGTSAGVALPAVSDPGGFLVFTGLPDGPIAVRLADGPERNNAWPR